MKVAEQLRQRIKKIPESEPFGYADLGIAPADFFTAAKAIERLQKTGMIKKVSKGVFYRPKETVFGTLGPDYEGLLKRNLYKNKKRVGYITEGELYNHLNLTTQNYFRTKIATSKSRKKVEKGVLKTTNVKTYVPVTEKNFPLLGILDAIKDIKNIDDTSTETALKILMAKIEEFDKATIGKILHYALQYPPKVRALLGAIIDYKFSNTFNTNTLQSTLNPLTNYIIGIELHVLPTMKKWKLK